MAGSVPDHRAAGVPAQYPESLRPNAGFCPHWGDAPSVPSEDITPPFAPTDSFARHSGLSPTSVYGLVGGVFAGCQPVPAARRTFPTLSLRIFPGCLIPYPGGPTACLCLFLPLGHRPSPIPARVGFPRIIRLKRLRADRKFRSGRYFLMFRVAVGTAVTRCPPHSPVLAQLAHTVPTLDVWRRSAHEDRDVRRGQREYGPQATPESVPRSSGSVGSAAEAGAATNAARLSETLSFAARCPVRRGIGNIPSPPTGSTSGYPRWTRACAVAAAP